MKNKILIFVAVVGLGSSFFFFFFKKSDLSSQGLSAESQALQEKAISQLIQSPRDSLSPKSNGLSPECQEFFSKLRSLDLRNDSASSSLPAEKCRKVPEAFSNLQAFYDQHCNSKPRSKECLLALYHYRAALTDFYTQDQSLSQISDPQVLFDKMLANRTTAPKKALEAAQRLSELEPHLYEAYKMEILQSLFIASQDPEKSDLDWNRLDSVIEKARELKGQDPELIEAVLLSEIFRNTDPRSLQDKARQFSEDSPQEWRGPYYLAWGLFNEGRGQEALDALMEAKRRDPQNPRINQSLEGLQKGKAKPFESGLSFSDLNLVTN